MQMCVSKTRRFIGISVLLVAVMLPSLSAAQNRPAPKSAASGTREMFVVNLVRARLDMVNEWQDLVKNELVPALRKGGVSEYIVLRTATFGGSGEFLLFRRIRDAAELDEPNPMVKALGQAGAAALSAKLTKATASMRTIGIETRPDLSILPSGYDPKLLAMTRTSVAPGRTAEYEKYSKEFLALAGKTNVKGVLVARVSSGGDPNEYWQSILVDSFADLQQIGAALGKARADAKLAPMPAGIIMRAERSMWRVVPELSIQSPAQKPAK